MKCTIINTDTGSVMQIVSVDMNSINGVFIRKGTALIAVEAKNLSDYWDGNEFVSIGIAPSSHHFFSYKEKKWIDLWDLKRYQSEALSVQKAIYSNREFEFEFMGKKIQSDLASQQRIQSVVVENSIDWITADNTILTLTRVQFDEMKLALSAHLQKMRNSYNNMKAKILNSSIDELRDLCG